MQFIIACALVYFIVGAESTDKDNVTYQKTPADRQLWEFGKKHYKPIGLWTTSSGSPVEIRDVMMINSDSARNPLLFDTMSNFNRENIPSRKFHAKGTSAFGYFEVTHDVSKYTHADVFNHIGKKTPVVTRFSTMLQGAGGSDVARDVKGMAVKFYTNQGIFDLLGSNTPINGLNLPIWVPYATHAFTNNPTTNLINMDAVWDIITLRPELLHFVLWILSDYSAPASYRNMDAFPVFTYETVNKHGETFYVKFSFRTEQGFIPLTDEQIAAIQGQDLDYHLRDLYNNIEDKNYPSWYLEMDVMSKHDITKVDYNPFDVLRLWKNGTFETVKIGRLVLNKNIENWFRDSEQVAFNPGNLVPGIPGPLDQLFKNVPTYYKDAQNYRLGRNHNNILVNRPLYTKKYDRDGRAPVLANGRDAPDYFPNSFNGPMPYINENRPMNLAILYNNAIDLEPASYFYNHLLMEDSQKTRLANNIAITLIPVKPPLLKRALELLHLVDHQLEEKVYFALAAARAEAAAQRPVAESSPKLPVFNVPTHMGHSGY